MTTLKAAGYNTAISIIFDWLEEIFDASVITNDRNKHRLMETVTSTGVIFQSKRVSRCDPCNLGGHTQN